MSGKAAAMSHFQPRCYSGGKTLGRCKNNRGGDNVVLIDVDSDRRHNIIIIDVPENLTKKVRGLNELKKDKHLPLRTIISIDDDDVTDNLHSGTSLNEDGKFESGASCSKPLKLSKSKRTYSGKVSSNHFGFSVDSDSESSDDDGAECEFMEDSSGKLREQWEKAFLKRKSDVNYSQSRRSEQDVRVDSVTESYSDSSVCSSPRNSSCEGEAQVPSFSMSTGKLQSSAETDWNSNVKTQVRQNYDNIPSSREFPKECCSEIIIEQHHTKYFEEPHCSPINHEDKDNSQQEGIVPPEKLEASNFHPKGDVNVCDAASLQGDVSSLRPGQCSIRPDAEWAPHSRRSHFQSESKLERSCLHSLKSDSNVRLSNETMFSKGVSSPVDQIEITPEETLRSKCCSLGNPETSNEMNYNEETEEPGPVSVSFRNFQLDEAKLEVTKISLEVGERICEGTVSCCQDENEKNDLLLAPKVDTISGLERCIINEREKLKETDEYKRAVEEEWISRQKFLKLQAEEAQRMRRLLKRRKAESMRLLDMERRQKQRVEEIRQTQKKDEENMNLKEAYRAEVREELSKLEMTCWDMASLLRGLGIHVAGGPYPLLYEVRASYKRALLSFHPDRASGSDMRQQVEAEEKFKLISQFEPMQFRGPNPKGRNAARWL